MIEDEDVVWKGSPLHKHLQGQGLEEFEDDIEDRNLDTKDNDISWETKSVDATSITTARDDENFDLTKIENGNGHHVEEVSNNEAVLIRSARSFIWPEENQLVLEVNVAKAILESELLVQEDDEFLHNFILNEETIAEYERLMTERPSRMSSLVSDMVLFSGSVAAVAGAVLYLSERGNIILMYMNQLSNGCWLWRGASYGIFLIKKRAIKELCVFFFQLRQPLRPRPFCQRRWQQCPR